MRPIQNSNNHAFPEPIVLHRTAEYTAHLCLLFIWFYLSLYIPLSVFPQECHQIIQPHTYRAANNREMSLHKITKWDLFYIRSICLNCFEEEENWEKQFIVEWVAKWWNMIMWTGKRYKTMVFSFCVRQLPKL